MRQKLQQSGQRFGLRLATISVGSVFLMSDQYGYERLLQGRTKQLRQIAGVIDLVDELAACRRVNHRLSLRRRRHLPSCYQSF
jgi:hypothetical protein